MFKQVFKKQKGFTQLQRMAGFTLVETLVAITILLLVIIGPMTIAQKGIQNAYFATQQTTATFLAQEAIEAVREVRDKQSLDVYNDPTRVFASRWLNNIDSSCKQVGTNGGCGYDFDNGFSSCTSCRLYQVNGRYTLARQNENGNTQGVLTPFTRKIFIDASNVEAVLVTVEVSWNSQVLGVRTIQLKTYLYNHYKRYEEN